MVLPQSLSNSKFPQISGTLLNILYAVVWIVSTRPQISNSSSPTYQPFKHHSELANLIHSSEDKGFYLSPEY